MCDAPSDMGCAHGKEFAATVAIAEDESGRHIFLSFHRSDFFEMRGVPTRLEEVEWLRAPDRDVVFSHDQLLARYRGRVAFLAIRDLPRNVPPSASAPSGEAATLRGLDP